jgi:hypothetical protein
VKHIISGIAFSAICFAVPVYAQTAEDEPAETAETVADVDPSQRIRCQTRRVTGSNARRVRICMTVAEWQETFDRGNTDARRVYDSGRVNSCAAVVCPN